MADYKISGLTAYPNSTFISTDLFEVSYYSGGIYYSRKLTGTQMFATLQEKLVSATNIKTINGSSILGSGDLTISSGGGVGSSLYLYNNFI